ncbi:MAG: hypothetical protein ACR2KJ_07335 [Jatrophihabitans sp.]
MVDCVPTGVYLYPWDIAGDELAADRVAAMGVDSVVLAAAYHAVRAVTPRHPRHRIVTAAEAAVYFPLDPLDWQGARVRPAEFPHDHDSFGSAVDAVRAAGPRVRAWVVLMHNATVGARHPDLVVRNAFGDRYPWALCPSHPEVVQYAVSVARSAACRPGVSGIELESCGWYGVGHGSSHDKVSGIPASGIDEVLMSLCFCTACAAAYGATGIDAVELRRRVTGGLAARFSHDLDTNEQGAGLAGVLGSALAAQVVAVRSEVADSLRRQVVAGVREATSPGFEVLLQADPRETATGANVGVDWAAAAADVDGLVLSCAGPIDTVAQRIRAARLSSAGRARTVASHQAVAGLAGTARELDDRVRATVRAGADEVVLYHAGLASASDLARMAEMIADRAVAPTPDGAADGHG